MKVDLYSSAGSKSGSLELPASMFEVKVNKGLMHLALIRQQSNRRTAIAHVKHRGEIAGSTKKLYQQKGTGRARRGSVRSPLLKGGGKSFGPRSNANFVKEMPQNMRRAALFSCLSVKAKEGAIIGLESYPDDPKTKTCYAMLKKMPLELGRRILVVVPGAQRGLELAARNIPRVKTLPAQYLNPEDVLGAQKIIFLKDAVKVAEETFMRKTRKIAAETTDPVEKPKVKKATKPAAKKTSTKKA